jgi:hypothetical protein
MVGGEEEESTVEEGRRGEMEIVSTFCFVRAVSPQRAKL